jgi:alkanesulfonate monooxygenase SsuD/methylene tetrahydromethanopterin reductase-like flavin-dependent oxidoreductase (luciferase family)
VSGSIIAALRYGRSAVTDEMYADEIAAVLGYLGADSGWLGSLAGFMHHIDLAGTESALALYRSEFRPSRWLGRPYAMLGVTTICADTDERANELARPFEVLLTRFSAALLPMQEAAEYQFTGEQKARLQATGPAGPEARHRW